MPTLRTLVMAAGAVAAAGGVATLPVVLKPDQAPELRIRSDYELCLKSDLVFFEGATARCYGAEDVRALKDRQVLDREGAPVVLSLTHPTDASVATMECRTCAHYREARFDGWFAQTARDARREAYFVRACGVLAAIAEAQPAERSHFANGSPSEQEVSQLAAGMSFGETLSSDRRVEAGAAYGWRIAAGTAEFAMQELANADFDNDGAEEILVYFTGGLAGGTASYYDIGYLEKDAADTPLVFTPLDFKSGRSGAAGGGV